MFLEYICDLTDFSMSAKPGKFIFYGQTGFSPLASHFLRVYKLIFLLVHSKFGGEELNSHRVEWT